MICAIYGTTGELIKLAPVLRGIEGRGGSYLNVTTAQQVEQIPHVLTQLGLSQPDVWLAHGRGGRELHTNRDIPFWLAGVATTFARSRRSISRTVRRGAGRPLVLVHGDTMTTLLGAFMGRALRMPVAHVEAGVRTWDIRHPFPEEATRRVVSKIATIHYAPGAQAAANIKRGTIVDTEMNTIRDSIELAAATASIPVSVPAGEFGVVSLHRYELLNNRELLRATLMALATHPGAPPMLFVDHPVTVAAMTRAGLSDVFTGSSVTRIARLDFFGFVSLLRQASFAITDSGGTQVESYVLDKPCLVHRKKVEQSDGLGENVVVSGFDLQILASFLDDPGRYRRTTHPPAVSPSKIILDDLEQRGYLVAGAAG